GRTSMARCEGQLQAIRSSVLGQGYQAFTRGSSVSVSTDRAGRDSWSSIPACGGWASWSKIPPYPEPICIRALACLLNPHLCGGIGPSACLVSPHFPQGDSC